MVPGLVLHPGLYIVKTNMNLRFCFSICVHVNNSLQKIPQSGQPRGRCARVSKSLQTPSVLNGFRNAIVRKHMKTQDFSIAKFSKSPSARMPDLRKNQWIVVIRESGSYGNLGFTPQTLI